MRCVVEGCDARSSYQASSPDEKALATMAKQSQYYFHYRENATLCVGEHVSDPNRAVDKRRVCFRSDSKVKLCSSTRWERSDASRLSPNSVSRFSPRVSHKKGLPHDSQRVLCRIQQRQETNVGHRARRREQLSSLLQGRRYRVVARRPFGGSTARAVDSVIHDRLSGESRRRDWNINDDHLTLFAMDGLRTLACAYRDLTESEVLSN